MSRNSRVFAAVLLLALWPTAQAGDDIESASPTSTASPLEVARALADQVESIAAGTRPRNWPLRHACLYYALAGQALLARYGIASELRIGNIDYRPGTGLHHPISPHVWLETETHFIDYAALPRWGRVEVIPRALVAETSGQVRPGATPVLAAPLRPDAALAQFLRHHERRFRLQLEGRRGARWHWPAVAGHGSCHPGPRRPPALEPARLVGTSCLD